MPHAIMQGTLLGSARKQLTLLQAGLHAPTTLLTINFVHGLLQTEEVQDGLLANVWIQIALEESKSQY